LAYRRKRNLREEIILAKRNGVALDKGTKGKVLEGARSWHEKSRRATFLRVQERKFLPVEPSNPEKKGLL